MGREPALFLAVLAGILNIIVAFGLGVSADQATLIIAAIDAVIGAAMAALTRPVAPAAFTTAVSAVFALLMGWGLDFTAEQVAAVNALVLAGLTLSTRKQVTPVYDPAPIS
jgi:hypothetical protein